MAETAAERAIRLMSQQAPFTNFVEFTSNLVREVFRTLVDSTREQIETYVDMVEQISGGPAEFVKNHIGDLDAAAMRYLNEVVRPAYALSQTGDPAEWTRDVVNGTFTPATVTLKAADVPALTNSFAGITLEIGDNDTPTEQPDDFSQALVVSSTAGANPTISLARLHKFTRAMLERAGRRSFDELQALLRMGLARVVPNKGFIETAMTFSIETSETSETTSNTTTTTHSNTNRGFSVGHSRSDQASFAVDLLRGTINRKLAINYGSSSRSNTVRVNVVNEKSTAATNLDVDITGRVRIDFITDYFPLLPGAPVPAGN